MYVAFQILQYAKYNGSILTTQMTRNYYKFTCLGWKINFRLDGPIAREEKCYIKNYDAILVMQQRTRISSEITLPPVKAATQF